MSQCEITVQLILVIYWRPPGTHRQEVHDIVSSRIEDLHNSKVRTIAEAVGEFMCSMRKEKDKAVAQRPERRTESSVKHTEISRCDLTPSKASSDSTATRSVTVAPTGSPPKRYDQRPRRRMWIGRRGVDRTTSWTFNEALVTPESINAFVLENASRLLENLSELDAESSSALNDHVRSLQAKLLAIKVRRQHNFLFQKRVASSISFATAEFNVMHEPYAQSEYQPHLVPRESAFDPPLLTSTEIVSPARTPGSTSNLANMSVTSSFGQSSASHSSLPHAFESSTYSPTADDQGLTRYFTPPECAVEVSNELPRRGYYPAPYPRLLKSVPTLQTTFQSSPTVP